MEQMMDLTAVSISVVSFVMVMGTLVSYLSTIPSGKVPVRPTGLVFFLSLGVLLAITSVVWNYQFSLSSHVIVNFPAFFAIFMIGITDGIAFHSATLGSAASATSISPASCRSARFFSPHMRLTIRPRWTGSRSAISSAHRLTFL
jgi:hypothetical protein